jgi:hypothetical protein
MMSGDEDLRPAAGLVAGTGLVGKRVALSGVPSEISWLNDVDRRLGEPHGKAVRVTG